MISARESPARFYNRSPTMGRTTVRAVVFLRAIALLAFSATPQQEPTIKVRTRCWFRWSSAIHKATLSAVSQERIFNFSTGTGCLRLLGLTVEHRALNPTDALNTPANPAAAPNAPSTVAPLAPPSFLFFLFDDLQISAADVSSLRGAAKRPRVDRAGFRRSDSPGDRLDALGIAGRSYGVVSIDRLRSGEVSKAECLDLAAQIRRNLWRSRLPADDRLGRVFEFCDFLG